MPRRSADTITVNVVAYPDRRDLVLRYRDPSTRRFHTRTAGTNSRREATKLAAQWEADLNTGRWKPGQRIEWEAFREKFEEQHFSGLAAKSQRKAKGILTMFGRLMSPYMLDGITSAMLSEVRRQTPTSQNCGPLRQVEGPLRNHDQRALASSHDGSALVEVARVSVRHPRDSSHRSRPEVGTQPTDERTCPNSGRIRGDGRLCCRADKA